MLDLADREPVRRRFRLDDDDLARAGGLGGGERHPLGARRRAPAPFKLDALPAGTWRAGLDRLLLGVTMTEEEQRLFGGRAAARRRRERRDRPRRAGSPSSSTGCGAALDALRAPQPIADWAAALAAAADALTATAPREAWQRAELQRVLDDVVAEAGGGVARRSRWPRSARCSPSACRAARRARTSARAT